MCIGGFSFEKLNFWKRPLFFGWYFMNIVQARQFVMGVVGLSSDEQNHLKQLLNKGVIVPLAVIDSTVDDLREIISLNPFQTGNSLIVWR